MLPQTYGTGKVSLDSGFGKPRLNLVAVFANFLVPWAAFGVTFWALSFSLRFSYPWLAWSLAALLLGAAGVSALAAFKWSNQSSRAAHWYHYFAWAMCISVLAGVVLGCLNYRYTMHDSYVLEMDLKLYKDVNVGQAKGQQMMDAGLVDFSSGSLDLQKAFSFIDGETYCVAPITNGQGPLPVYDFWAVGVNCCSKVDFHCGEYKNPRAHSGVRLLSASARPHLKLAVQAAEAAYGIRSAHPLFFEWVEDPVSQLHEQRSHGYQFFLFCKLCHFGCSILAVTAAILAYASL